MISNTLFFIISTVVCVTLLYKIIRSIYVNIRYVYKYKLKIKVVCIPVNLSSGGFDCSEIYKNSRFPRLDTSVTFSIDIRNLTEDEKQTFLFLNEKGKYVINKTKAHEYLHKKFKFNPVLSISPSRMYYTDGTTRIEEKLVDDYDYVKEPVTKWINRRTGYSTYSEPYVDINEYYTITVYENRRRKVGSHTEKIHYLVDYHTELVGIVDIRSII